MINTQAKDGTVKTTGIHQTRLSNKAITNIVGHYNSQLDQSDGAMPEVKISAVVSESPTALMQINPNVSTTTIQVNKTSADSKGGFVSRLLNTVSNMKSTLVHERKHVKQFQKKDTRNIEEKELDAIETQREHSTWKGTTEGQPDTYKESIKRYEDEQKEKQARRNQ